MADIWRCETCGKTYPEYVNGCVLDHDPPGHVVLVMSDEDGTPEQRDRIVQWLTDPAGYWEERCAKAEMELTRLRYILAPDTPRYEAMVERLAPLVASPQRPHWLLLNERTKEDCRNAVYLVLAALKEEIDRG